MDQMRHNGNTRSRNYVWWNPLRYPPLAAPQNQQVPGLKIYKKIPEVCFNL